jgi:hypothetical protein
MRDDPPGIVELFKLLKPMLEYDYMRQIWIQKRTVTSRDLEHDK